VPDEKWGERPLALVVLKKEYEGKVTEEDIKAHIAGFVDSGVISGWAVPDRVSLVEALPKTSVGKLNKKEMRRRYAAPTEKLKA
jgi:fatty-acyl-CoA synthase